MNNSIEFKLRINCMTFNHAPYIVDSMNGFCMQQSTFPYVAIIIDDASTDGTPEVINRYLLDHFDLEDKDIVRNEETDDYVMTFARHNSNQNCYFAVFLLKYNHYRKNKEKWPYYLEFAKVPLYIATCEGDDYWTDPHKLQMQVDFLDSHPDFSMCFHRVKIKVEKDRITTEKNIFDFLENKEYTKEDQLSLNRIVPTCSILCRSSISALSPKNSKFTIGDIVIVATCLTHGRIFCLGNEMGVYRLVPNGWTAMSEKQMCYSMFSNYQGMIESFPWYQCEKGYKTFKFWTFSLLTILKKENNKSEFRKIVSEYKSFMKTNSLWDFRLYYFNRIIRAFLRKILGNKLTKFKEIVIQKS